MATQLPTSSSVRYAPPVVGAITTLDATFNTCGNHTLKAQFVELVDGCEQYPRFVFVDLTTTIRQETAYGYGYGADSGYGYGDYTQTTTQQRLVLEITTPGDLSIQTGSGIYEDSTGTFQLFWQSGEWVVIGLAPGETLRLSNGSQYNPLMAEGELVYYDNTTATTYSYDFNVLHFIPTDGYGTSTAFFDCGNHVFGASDPIPYSLTYTDNSIEAAEWEITGPTGVEYVTSSTFDSTSGRATLRFKANQNGSYSFRVRGISEHNFSTRFGNLITFVINVAPPVVSWDVSDEETFCLSTGETVVVTESSHTFNYDLSSNCFLTKHIEYALDDGQWQSTQQVTGLLEIKNLLNGSHTLQIRALDEAGQYSSIDTLSFYVSLATFVTIDDVPSDPLCGPGKTTTIGGSRDTNAKITLITGVITDTLRYPTTSTWEADIYLIGDKTQIIEVTVENLFGQTASANYSLYFKNRLPKITATALQEVTYISKAILRGTKDQDTSVEISHNTGSWTTIIESNSSTSWEYVVELVSGINQIKLRAVDSDCGFEGESVTVQTIYADSTFVNGAFQINSGDITTSSTSVFLSFISTTATRVQISNFDDFREGYETDFAERISWTLTDNPGTKTVYVKFKNNNALESITYSDSILLTASQNLTTETVGVHQVHSLDAIDSLTGGSLGTVIVIQDNRNGTYSVYVYQDPIAALEGKQPIATANTIYTGRQRLILTDTGTGLVQVTGTIDVTIVQGAEDLYMDHRTDIWSITTGESVIPLQYEIVEDAQYFYALITLPYYESRFQGAVKEVVSVDQQAGISVIKVDKVFTLLQPLENDGYGYSSVFAQALENIPTPLKEQFATYPLTGMRLWYPTLAEYSMITEIEETSDAFILTIDQALKSFEPALACRIEFTRQNKQYIDYRISKATGIVEFINESSYATGNVQFEYEYARENKGRPNSNWYVLCGLKYNDLVTLTLPQTQNRITFEQLKSICVRFYNGDEGTAPKIVRFIINDTIVYEDRTSDVIEGIEGYGYSYGPVGYGYSLTPGQGDQVVEFCAENTISNNLIVDKIQIEFRATTNCMYIGEVLINAQSIPLQSNLQVLINDTTVFSSTDPVSSNFDKYEIRLEKNEADIWYNNQFVKNIDVSNFDKDSIKRFIGASARTSGDEVKGVFQEVRDKKYYDTDQINVGLVGRFIGIEANVRKQNDET